MFPRVLSVLLSLVLLLGGIFFTAYLLKLYTVEPALPVILVPVIVVVGWLNWQAIGRLSRYGGKPFQVRREYQLHLYHDRDALIGPIVVEGAALLIVKFSVPAAQIRLAEIGPADERFCRKFPYGAREVEFLVGDRGTWSAMLAARAPKIPFSSFQLTLGAREEGYFTTLIVELRGIGRVLQFPDHADEVVRGFPVVVKGPPELS